MHIEISCTAALELLQRDSVPYIAFSDEASSKS
jgi:hypothetical protein